MPNRILTVGLSIVSAAAMTISLSACSSGSSFPEETIKGYFAPLGSAAPAEKESAMSFAAPDSVAAMYVAEQIAHAQAQQDGGTLDAASQEVVIDSGSVFLCAAGFDTEGAERTDFCSEYSNIVFDEDDKIVSFDAGGKPLGGRIALGDGSAIPIADAGSVTYLSSYVTIGGDLVVVVEVASSVDPLTIMSYDATYVAEDGRPTSAKASDGPLDVKSDRVGNVALWFANVGLGGTLELEFQDADYNTLSVDIPTAK